MVSINPYSLESSRVEINKIVKKFNNIKISVNKEGVSPEEISKDITSICLTIAKSNFNERSQDVIGDLRSIEHKISKYGISRGGEGKTLKNVDLIKTIERLKNRMLYRFYEGEKMSKSTHSTEIETKLKKVSGISSKDEKDEKEMKEEVASSISSGRIIVTPPPPSSSPVKKVKSQPVSESSLSPSAASHPRSQSEFNIKFRDDSIHSYNLIVEGSRKTEADDLKEKFEAYVKSSIVDNQTEEKVLEKLKEYKHVKLKVILPPSTKENPTKSKILLDRKFSDGTRKTYQISLHETSSKNLEDTKKGITEEFRRVRSDRSLKKFKDHIKEYNLQRGAEIVRVSAYSHKKLATEVSHSRGSKRRSTSSTSSTSSTPSFVETSERKR